MTGPITIERVIARLNIGGPAIHSILLTRRFNDIGYPSQLLTGVEGPDEGNMLGLAASKGVEPIIFPGLGRELSPVSDLAVTFALYRRFRKTRPTIVHTHTAKAGVVGRIAAAAARVPIRVHTFHGHVFHGYFSPAKTKMFIQIEKAMARLSTRIVVLGERQKRDILSLGIGREQQYEIVPLGLELDGFTRASARAGELRSELGVAPSVPLVLIVARLVPVKNHTLFLDAAKLVADKRPDALFVVAGDGPGREAIKSHSRQIGIDHQVRFLGFRDDLARLYADCNVSVLCSKNEGMPVALIESLSSGTPVVATDVGETRTIVDDGVTGLVVAPGDSTALAEGILKMIEQPDAARQMGEAGRATVPQRFGIDRLVVDLQRLYTSLCEGL